MGDLIQNGKVRYFGVSNYRAWRVAEICNICDRLGIDRPIVSQPYYNAMNRMPEVEHFPACGYYGLGIVPYSPLARGVLTGKYKVDAAPDKETRAGRAESSGEKGSGSGFISKPDRRRRSAGGPADRSRSGPIRRDRTRLEMVVPASVSVWI